MKKERYAWKARIHEGQLDEYIRRHDALWPEMRAILKEAGIGNYSIWVVGNELFGYFECEKGADVAVEVQATSAVVARWNNYMADIMTMEISLHAQPKMREVFYLP